jgi:hypothetical protein
MSNPSTPFGFQYLGLIDGGPPNFGVKTVQLSSTNAHKIYGGDVAAVISGGFYDVATVTGGGAPIGGIFLPDFVWQSVSQQQTVRQRAWLGNFADIVAGGVVTCRVVINPNAVFRARTTGTTGAAVTQANVGSNINFNVGAGPGNNLISTFSADDGTIGSGASLPFRIYNIVPNPPSDATSVYDQIDVIFNNLTQV